MEADGQCSGGAVERGWAEGRVCRERRRWEVYSALYNLVASRANEGGATLHLSGRLTGRLHPPGMCCFYARVFFIFFLSIEKEALRKKYIFSGVL